MTFDHYMEFVNAGLDLREHGDTDRERLLLGGLGVADEAGEVAGLAKKTAFHGKTMDRTKLLKEMGDVLWYFAIIARLYDMTLDEIMEANVFKLCDRYPRLHGDPEDIITERAV